MTTLCSMTWKRNPALGDYFRQRMRRSGVTQRVLASRLGGLDSTTLGRKLSGEVGFSQDEIRTISQVLGIEIPLTLIQDIDPVKDLPTLDALEDVEDYELALQVLQQTLPRITHHERRGLYFALAMILRGLRQDDTAETLKGLSRYT